MSVNRLAGIVPALGRPNKISRALIVEAALEIGLDKVTMTSVAARLGVSTGALYRHVRNRSELQRLVAGAQIRDNLAPRDIGQHWAVLIHGYAAMLFDQFLENPELIFEYANGGFPPDNEVEMFENYLTAMDRRGFRGDDALNLMRDVRAIAIGAAVVATAMRGAHSDPGAEVDRILAERGAQELPMLGACHAAYRRTVTEPGWQDTLQKVLSAVAAAREETLPENWRSI